MPERIRLGFSPCPNDTFMFDALVHGKIDTGNLDIEVVMADVEALNRMAFEGQLEVTKLSYHAFAHLTSNYQLLNAGSALGRNCGPLLIAKEAVDHDKVKDMEIAIPGHFTTANFLLSLAFPSAIKKKEMVFSEIEDAVLNGTVDAGLIIHENRFTYEQKGLKKIVDLGEFWEGNTGAPIPLGGIVVRRTLPEATRQQLDRLVAESVRYAFNNREASRNYVRQHAQEMDDAVMDSHINLYANDFSENLGQEGRFAVETLFKMAVQKRILPEFPENLFVEHSTAQPGHTQ